MVTTPAAHIALERLMPTHTTLARRMQTQDTPMRHTQRLRMVAAAVPIRRLLMQAAVVGMQAVVAGMPVAAVAEAIPVAVGIADISNRIAAE
jgi:hypothetical protein